MYQTPRSSQTGELSFTEAEKTISAANEQLKEFYDSTEFLLRFENGDIVVEFDGPY